MFPKAYSKEYIEQLATTEGGIRVRMKFNPSEDATVTNIKVKAAELINVAEAIKHGDHSEHAGRIARNASHAATLIEDAAMNLVKAATYKY
jgi:hypothetical protein